VKNSCVAITAQKHSLNVFRILLPAATVIHFDWAMIFPIVVTKSTAAVKWGFES
jgi:hypothetical protein